MAAPASGFNVPGSSSGAPAGSSSTATRKKKSRAGTRKKKRDRRKSFALTNDETEHDDGMSTSIAGQSQSFYGQRHNLSNTSIDSETLLDHRYESPPPSTGFFTYILRASCFTCGLAFVPG